MTASVAGNFASSKIKGIFQDEEGANQSREQNMREAGDRIAKTLGELKGAVMKVGQMASVASDILPKELTQALSTLQKDAPPMAYEVIESQLVKELGGLPEEKFQTFDRAPFASASIGQVHKATTHDGREVIVKVQYPGVDKAVDSDLRQLKLALRASGIINVSKKALDDTFQETRERLHEELNYEHEAANTRLMAELHSTDQFLVVPKVVDELSSRRVLTIMYEAGDTFEHAGSHYDQETRDLLGARLLSLMAIQIFRNGAIHGDPNPGNFAVREDGTIVMYDYGCIKRLPRDLVFAYRDLIVSSIAEDYAGTEGALRRLGLRNLDGPPVEFEFYKRFRDIFVIPHQNRTPYDYGESRMGEQVMKLVPSVMKRIASFQPAKDLIFVDRMVGGHYGNMRTLRCRVPVLDTLEPYWNNVDGAPLAGLAEASD
jgi:predicted unusual protein kinase regulating ubiquinone biosynthesis (AarF/ABC1/UbiB family)